MKERKTKGTKGGRAKGKKEEILDKNFERIHREVSEIIERHREMASVD